MVTYQILIVKYFRKRGIMAQVEIIKANLNKEKGLEKKETTKAVHLSSGGKDISGKKRGGCC